MDALTSVMSAVFSRAWVPMMKPTRRGVDDDTGRGDSTPSARSRSTVAWETGTGYVNRDHLWERPYLLPE